MNTTLVGAVDVHGNASSTFTGLMIPCAPPACSFSAHDPYTGFTLARLLTATRYDTTFYSGYFRAAYDLTQGWVYALANGQSGTSLTTTTNDTYWVVGVTVGPPLTFSGSLQVVGHTTQYCGYHCAFGYVGASIAEPGVASTSCPGASQPCVLLTHRAYEPFQLSVSAQAGIGGSVYSAAANVNAALHFTGLPPEAVDFLYDRYYNAGRSPRASDCRDLLEIVQSICRYRRQPVQLTRDLIAEAATTFISSGKSIAARRRRSGRASMRLQQTGADTSPTRTAP